MSSPVSMLPLYVSARGWARLFVAFLLAAVGVTWLCVGFDLANLNALAREAAGESVGRGLQSSFHKADEALVVARWITLVTASLAFLAWMYRARVNARALGGRRFRYGRAWAIGGFLVPGLNLLRPYQVLGEVWRASNPDVSDPFAWKDLPTPRLLTGWWSLMLAWIGMSLLAWALASGAHGEVLKVRFAEWVGTLADTLCAIALSVAYFVVVEITDCQEDKRALHSAALDAPQAV